MNPTEAWQQLLAAPGDQALKAQYVQALAAIGDERADLFSLAADIAKFRVSYPKRADALRPRYERLFADWRVGFESAAKAWQAEVTFVIGWPSELTLTAQDFVRHAAAIVTTMPLRHLNLRAVSDTPEVFSGPAMDQIASLDASNQSWSDEAVHALAVAPRLRSLRWLDLRRSRLTDQRVEILAGSSSLRMLDQIDLRDNPCRDPVDAAAGYGFDPCTGEIANGSVWLPEFGKELESRHGEIPWLHVLGQHGEFFPLDRYRY